VFLAMPYRISTLGMPKASKYPRAPSAIAHAPKSKFKSTSGGVIVSREQAGVADKGWLEWYR
jgi:hypothetical protein